ncbi:hypothetical protein BDZ97DRAFT_1909005 [Flammula alnicola]|nr:hypothetical protein BDZ97DRAFT_1909005 [Flammula alnicola]
MSSHNRNPAGKNQHATVPSADDPLLAEALIKYHREGISSNDRIKQRLLAEYGISASVSCIKRRRNDLRLYGPRSKLQQLTDKEKEQVVLQQLDKDPAKGQGLSTIKNHIAHDQGIQLSRDVISGIMHIHDAEAFLAREPGAKRIHRVPKAPIGIHERWAGDGHDKLYKIGFPIWAVVDDATGKYLGAWVVPSNRMGDIIGYLFLCLVERYKGLPLQFTTDCGSETTQLYGLVNALRQLSQWLWSKALQLALDNFMSMRNAQKMRKDNEKAGPSGCSRNDAFSLPHNFGLSNELLPLNDDQLKIVSEIKEFMGGDALLAFVSTEFSAKAELAYISLAEMAKCSYCGIDFPLLADRDNEAVVRCGKCALRVPGLSVPEIAIINVCLILQHAPHIPTAILRIQGVAPLLLEQNTMGMGDDLDLTDGTSAVITSAQEYQAKASDPRLNKPSTARGAEGGLNRFKNLGKAQSVIAERKGKRDEANLIGVGIKVSATLWKIPQGHGKMLPITPIRVTHVFSPDNETKKALEKLLLSVRKSFETQHPDAELLTWANISLYAHETQQKYSSLDHFDYSLPMEQFFHEFVKGKLAVETMLKDKKIEIRFAFFEETVFPDGDNLTESFRLPSHSKASSALTKASSAVGPKKSKRARTDVASAMPASSSRQVSLSQPIRSSFTFAVPDIPQRIGRPVLKSAFRPPATRPNWTRDIEMTACSFLRTKATYALKDGLHVRFETMEIAEEIQIAAKWEKVGDDGYIGEGFTKRGIYARFMGKEYVLTQPIDSHMEQSAVESVLRAEYALLCIGNTLKQEFDSHAQEYGATSIPSARFIATPLLPCGELDGKIQKFTGNDEFGDANDHLTKAIHAFSHFTAVYTQKNIVLCDLQGEICLLPKS